MKKISGLFCIILLLLLAATASAATSTTTSDSTSTTAQDAASLVYVSSVKIDPEVFYPYEQGTITVTLTNSGTSSVGLSNPDILSEKIHIMNKDSLEHHEFYRAGINDDLLVSGKGRSSRMGPISRCFLWEHKMPGVSIILSRSKWIPLISRRASHKNPIPLPCQQKTPST